MKISFVFLAVFILPSFGMSDFGAYSDRSDLQGFDIDSYDSVPYVSGPYGALSVRERKSFLGRRSGHQGYGFQHDDHYVGGLETLGSMQSTNICQTEGSGAKCLSPEAALTCLEVQYPHAHIQEEGEGVQTAFLYGRQRLKLVSQDEQGVAGSQIVPMKSLRDAACLSQLHMTAFKEGRLGRFYPFRGRNTAVFDLQSWMKDLEPVIGSRTLRNIAIPGSNHSGTSFISARSPGARGQNIPLKLDVIRKYAQSKFRDVVASWLKTQSLTVKEQLESGVRYLNLHIVPAEGTYITAHGLSGEYIESTLKDVRAFLDENPQEIVIIDFESIVGGYTPSLEQHLLNLLGAEEGDEFAKVDDLNRPLSELFQENKRIFLMVSQLEEIMPDSQIAIDRRALESRNPHVSTQQEFEFTMVPYLMSLESQWGEQKPLTVIQGFLTPDTRNVVEGLSPRSTVHDRQGFAQKWEGYVLRNVENWVGSVRGAIVSNDFVNPEIAQAVVRLNSLLSDTEELQTPHS